MSTDIQARPGTGRFQWNASGWLGLVAGSTAWMMIAAGFLIANLEVAVAAIPFGCFLVTSLIAYALWMRRGRLDPFWSLIAILTVLAITMPTAWIGVSTWAAPGTLAQMNFPSAAGWKFVVLLLAPGMMIWCYVLERQAKQMPSRTQHQKLT